MDEIPRSDPDGYFDWFTPGSDAEWAAAEINLSDYVGAANAQVRFALVSGYGNDFWLDNFSVADTSFVSIEEPVARALESIRVSPNPTDGTALLTLDMKSAATASVVLYDLTGRRVSGLPAQTLLPGENELELNLSGLPAGVYTALVSLDGQLRALKVIRQ